MIADRSIGSVGADARTWHTSACTHCARLTTLCVVGRLWLTCESMHAASAHVAESALTLRSTWNSSRPLARPRRRPNTNCGRTTSGSGGHRRGRLAPQAGVLLAFLLVAQPVLGQSLDGFYIGTLSRGDRSLDVGLELNADHGALSGSYYYFGPSEEALTLKGTIDALERSSSPSPALMGRPQGSGREGAQG